MQKIKRCLKMLFTLKMAVLSVFGQKDGLGTLGINLLDPFIGVI